jgi:hypothetical protein
MKVLVSIFLVTLSTLSMANDQIVDLLKKYEAKGINHKCEVIYTPEVLTIKGSATRSSTSIYLDDLNVEVKSNKLIQATHHSLAGTGVALFIKGKAKLTVVLTWEDGELGDDESSFCVLPLN